MTARLRRLAALAIGLLPSNRLRLALYRCILRYDVSRDAQIGWMTIVLVDHASIGRATIGRRNRFVGPFALEIRDGARIGSQNDVVCGDWTASPQFQHVGYERYCRLGADSVITDRHVIDVAGGFELGEQSWIASRSSQFWSHGAGAQERSIRIGSRCYIGSAARFAPGSAVADDTIVSLGSVVTAPFSEPRCLIGGVPARALKSGHDWHDRISGGAGGGEAGGGPGE